MFMHLRNFNLSLSVSQIKENIYIYISAMVGWDPNLVVLVEWLDPFVSLPFYVVLTSTTFLVIGDENDALILFFLSLLIFPLL